MKMKVFVLLITLVFASEIQENDKEKSIFVKIEVDDWDEDIKQNNRAAEISNYIGVSYIRKNAVWSAQRKSENEKKKVFNGCYKNEETAAHASDTLARKLMAKGELNHKLNFPDDDTEVYPEQKETSKFIGVSYNEKSKKWRAQRCSRNENKQVSNGCTYKDEETAAHASDTVARKLIANGELGHKLNFPDDDTEVYPKKTSSKFIGVMYTKINEKWLVSRLSKIENKGISNGSYKDEETAAHASDTLARKLIANGELGHKLNFPDDDTEVYPEQRKPSKFIGVHYHEKSKRWRADKYSKNKTKPVSNGSYKNEETAARASDTVARQLIANGELGHKLNFPDDDTEVYCEQKKTSKFIGVSYNKERSKWYAQRKSKSENKKVSNGLAYKDEETAAHASDTLARKLMAKGELNHKINFPDDDTEVYPQKPKVYGISNYIGVSYDKYHAAWIARRWSRNENKQVFNGSYKNGVTAAHASDTLARKLIANGELGHKLNFPEDYTEVYPEKKITSKFLGVSYNEKSKKWRAQRSSKNENKQVSNGCTYKDEETAAHASDTVARKLMANGELGHKLNFPDNNTEVYPNRVSKMSNYIGVSYRKTLWIARRRSKNDDKMVFNGSSKDEETAAHASDTLARQLMKNGELGHKLNFPDDDTEVHPHQRNKRKRTDHKDLKHSQNK